MSMDIPFGTFEEELPKEPVRITAYVDCVNLERMLHEVKGYQVSVKTTVASSGKEAKALGGRAEELSFYSDEPPRLGGGGKYPQPLTYIAGGVGT